MALKNRENDYYQPLRHIWPEVTFLLGQKFERCLMCNTKLWDLRLLLNISASSCEKQLQGWTKWHLASLKIRMLSFNPWCSYLRLWVRTFTAGNMVNCRGPRRTKVLLIVSDFWTGCPPPEEMFCQFTSQPKTKQGRTTHTNTHVWQTWARNVLTRLSCLLQMSFWNELFNQSSMLHTCRTLLEYQQTVK